MHFWWFPRPVEEQKKISYIESEGPGGGGHQVSSSIQSD